MTTMRRIRNKRKTTKKHPGWNKQSHSTYCRQDDSTSCGFFVGFYYECFQQLGAIGDYFKDGLSANFMRSYYRQRVVDILHSIYLLEFPAYVALGDLYVPANNELAHEHTAPITGPNSRVVVNSHYACRRHHAAHNRNCHT